jgi:transcriptional regulator with PAS, ATPase and Fis domain
MESVWEVSVPQNTSIEHDLFDLLRSIELHPSEFLEKLRQVPACDLDPYMQLGRCYALIHTCAYQEAETGILDLLTKALNDSDKRLLATSYLLASDIAHNLHRDYQEEPYLHQALESAKIAQDQDLIAYILCYKALYYQRLNNRKQALDCLNLAAGQISATSAPRVHYRVLRDSGTVFFNFQLYPKALDCTAKALEISLKHGDIHDQLMCLNNLSSLYMKMEKYEEAYRILQRGIELSSDHNVIIRKLSFIFNLGVMLLKQGKGEQSLESFIECEETAKKIGFENKTFLIELYSNLAGSYTFLKHHESALVYLDQALEVSAKIGDRYQMAELKINRANVLCGMMRTAEARELLKDVIDFARKGKHSDLYRYALSNMADSYELQKDYKTANKYLRNINKAYRNEMQYVMQEQSAKHSAEISALVNELKGVKEQAQRDQGELGDISFGFLGISNIRRDVLDKALKAAHHPYATVLITGETGTGKDVLANLIHNNSFRREARFVPVNMAAIAENLMESAFFGHVKGAFTGANVGSKGFFMEAHRGTLFLDEISDMPLPLQAKLLRALESHKVTPVGSSKELEFDTRVICSSNRDLPNLVERGVFRRDLYYRLNTITINLPPLRERPEDIKPITVFFVDKYCREINKTRPTIADSFYAYLAKYSFPGNIRELRNIVEHLVIMHDGNTWTDKSLMHLVSPNKLNHDSKPAKSKGVADSEEKSKLISTLQACNGKQKDTAQCLGISEATLTRRIKQYHLEVYTRKGSSKHKT